MSEDTPPDPADPDDDPAEPYYDPSESLGEELSQEPGEGALPTAPSDTCCSLRRKLLVGILRVLTEDECGVPDIELADVMRFDLKSPTGKPVIAFRFCPWCGKPRDRHGETRIVDIGPADPDEDGGSGLAS